ncbi:hypothetical protein AJ85_21270 [Alkalihalobacillus alcalophilus ATCC 27647 = CGMCC 1.3604]|uniref:Uncharacterized protein n=1 Tax=Alkalihalobacillus alcalophilus ATCC 27647 = CGMCC 1.3604 TaxID=1218173 RepID=A0A094XDS7_ALKAL|nr:hypothetical protein [Alkalihalobacillus alcalophilus]KGA96935.1 hypothetical protein BALCAV_0213350 [Alkalihalobacillus alcalophilus ATCC 27647 = CGMCC 1.3604]MED1562289.1 hypothetical protein [Alkalihalobacillus alcalophilus]THG88822.1 hypothetical protein AJ85_21270 [Alkalihalobacillus alcalophilus ATCC 27647 = CGMCC 1.3604]
MGIFFEKATKPSLKPFMIARIVILFMIFIQCVFFFFHEFQYNLLAMTLLLVAIGSLLDGIEAIIQGDRLYKYFALSGVFFLLALITFSI